MPGLPNPGASRGIIGALHGEKSYHRGASRWGEEGDQTDKDKKKKKIYLFKAKALQEVEELPLGIVSFLQPRLESHF